MMLNLRMNGRKMPAIAANPQMRTMTLKAGPESPVLSAPNFELAIGCF
jgi:hypothetical protein